jgi:transketolase
MWNRDSFLMDGEFLMSTTATGAFYNFSIKCCEFMAVPSSDLEGIYNAIADARKPWGKPTLIRLRTTIGYGSKQQGTHGVHGSREFFRINRDSQLANAQGSA